jgi:hypothetical protein
MSTVVVDQAKLVLNAFAAIFQNNLISADLCTWKKFDGEMNDRNALTVVEQVVPDYSTTFTNNAVADLSAGVQSTTFGSEQYRLTQIVGTNMGWGDFIKIRDINEARESEAVKAAALRLAHDIDAYIMRYMALMSNNGLGDGVSPVATWDDVVSGYTRLKEEGVEDDQNLRAVLTYGDKQALGKEIVEDNQTGNLSALGGGVYREGWQGKIGGIPTSFTQQLPSFTVGTRLQTSALTAGTAQSATTYEQVAISPAPGQYMTQILTIDIGSGTETVKDGELFTITGVFAWDNRAKKALNHLQQFRVVGDVEAVGGIAQVRVFPALILTGPFQTIAQAPANTAAVAFQGNPGVTLQPRFIANKDAVTISTADLIMPATGVARRQSLSKLPMSVRMWQHSEFGTGEHKVRFDVAIEANVRAGGRRRVVRING